MFNKVFGEVLSEVTTVFGNVGGGKAEITLSIFYRLQ